MGFFAANTLFMRFAPVIPICDICKRIIVPGRVFWNCFFYGVFYTLVFTQSFIIHHLSNSKTIKHYSIAMMIYSVAFFMYFLFIINKSLPTYIVACNSKDAALMFSIGVFLIIASVLAFLKEHTAIYVTVGALAFVFALILFSYIIIPK